MGEGGWRGTSGHESDGYGRMESHLAVYLQRIYVYLQNLAIYLQKKKRPPIFS